MHGASKSAFGSDSSPHIAHVKHFVQGADVSRVPRVLGILVNSVDFINPHPMLPNVPCTRCSSIQHGHLAMQPNVAKCDRTCFHGSINRRRGFLRSYCCASRMSLLFSLGVLFRATCSILGQRGIFMGSGGTRWGRPSVGS